MFIAAINWTAIGSIAGIAGVLVVIGGGVVTTSKGWRDRREQAKNRLDRLEIRLFGLPADPESGAPKIPGEFDRIDRRLDALPAQIIAQLNQNGSTHA